MTYLERGAMRFSSRKLVMMALLIALAILLRRILSLPFTLGGIHFGMVSFGGFPIILAGLLFGPLEGAIVGAVSDVLGFPFMPKGPYIPYFTVTAALTGMIPALILSPRENKAQTLSHVFISILIGQAVTKVLLVPYFQYLAFYWPFVPNALASVIVEMVHVPLYTSMAYPILRALSTGEYSGFLQRGSLPVGADRLQEPATLPKERGR
jgi:ECF transporter S component (folate family)